MFAKKVYIQNYIVYLIAISIFKKRHFVKGLPKHLISMYDF